MSNKAASFVAQVFGFLTTIEAKYRAPMGTKGQYASYCKVRCVCGIEKHVLLGNLASGHTKSCGCKTREMIGQATSSHGHSRGGKPTPEYAAYLSMLARCYNPKHIQYKDWGGRGIKVFPEWLGPGGFERWLAHIGLKPHPKMTQERDNVNGNYEPGNVRWATPKEQANNTRANHYITHNNQTLTLAQWSEVVGIGSATIRYRLQRGWTATDALTRPVQVQNKRKKEKCK